MSFAIHGNTRGLSPSEIRSVEKLYRRSVDSDHIVSIPLAREVSELARKIGRIIGLLINREGNIESVILGTRTIIYLPDLGRYRLGEGRLRRLRLIFSDLTKGREGVLPIIPADIITDLEKLRLDSVVGVREHSAGVAVKIAHLIGTDDLQKSPTSFIELENYNEDTLNFLQLIETIEDDLAAHDTYRTNIKNAAVLVCVYRKSNLHWKESAEELTELARTAGVTVVETVIQRRDPDPRTVVGQGKLEEIVLLALRLGAEILIFDGELKPAQWRVITNLTELKILDRSMVILDIFAGRARSSDGRLQVELAQLKYNLPRLVEKDAGLSRLTGGIGGRGPGETKLEIGRRRARDRIRDLEKQIDKLSAQRELRRKKRKEIPIPLIAIIGYTNAGKSTLFNALTGSKELAEDKLFATLEPTQGRYVIPNKFDPAAIDIATEESTTQSYVDYGTPVIFTDTVGFIRDLPSELKNAFRATLEELYEAHLLLHVVDASSPYASEQISSVEEVLTEMDLLETPKILVWNKVDLITEDRQMELKLLSEDYSKVYYLSAIKKEGFALLLEAVASEVRDNGGEQKV